MTRTEATQTINLIKSLLPAFEEIIQEVRRGHGFLNFEPRLVEFLSKGEASPWAVFYQDFNQIKALSLFAMFEPDDIPELAEFLRAGSIKEKALFSKELTEAVQFGAASNSTIGKVVSEAEAQRWWTEASEKERTNATTSATLQLYSIITQVCHYFGIMTFGRSLCSLVADAIHGDDLAYCYAVQIDKTILYSIPYFRERLARAQLSYDFQFLQNLSTAMVGKPLAGYIKHKELMFVFAILDDEGLLGMPINQLFEICDQLGIYGTKYGVFDADSLRKRRSYYILKTGRKLKNSRPSH